MKTKEKRITIPKLRHHKASGRAYVVLNSRAIYMGDWGCEESQENYRKTIAEWMAAGKQPQGSHDLQSMKSSPDSGYMRKTTTAILTERQQVNWIVCDMHFGHYLNYMAIR